MTDKPYRTAAHYVTVPAALVFASLVSMGISGLQRSIDDHPQQPETMSIPAATTTVVPEKSAADGRPKPNVTPSASLTSARPVIEQKPIPEKQQFAAGTQICKPLVGTGATGFVGKIDADGTLTSLCGYKATDQKVPASLTKLMTLYILFEEMEAGRFGKDSKLKISSRADNVEGYNLVHRGHEISVDDAIKSIVTLSANNIATAIAENISGTEEAFVQRMNEMAAKLGMMNSKFINASGLPGDGTANNKTTAYDLAKLAAAINARFAEQAKVFAITEMKFQGQEIATHIPYVGEFNNIFTGMKTGYTEKARQTVVSRVEVGGEKYLVVILSAPSKDDRRDQLFSLARAYIPGFTGELQASRKHPGKAVTARFSRIHTASAQPK